MMYVTIKTLADVAYDDENGYPVTMKKGEEFTVSAITLYTESPYEDNAFTLYRDKTGTESSAITFDNALYSIVSIVAE